jgi:AAHS family 4-hydroxybenzoate transporter-like MFS transporter
MASKTLDISNLVDQVKVGNFQKLVIGLCGTILFLDGFDAQAIGYVAPALLEAHVVTPKQLGPLFAASLIGLMMGAMLLAPRADRVGRRPVLIVSTMVVGAFSLATAWATGLNELLCLRFLTGIGLGGCMPNAVALVSEYSPAKQRGFFVSVVFGGFTLGSLLGGVVSAQLVPTHGWHWVFVIGGVLPLLLVPVLFYFLPESIRYLVSRRKHPEQVARIVHRMYPKLSIDPNTSFTLADEPPTKTSVWQLLTPERARFTTLLWIIFFMSLLVIYLLVNWLPTILKDSGASMRNAIFIGTALQLGALVGAFPLGHLLDRKGPRLTIGVSYLLGAFSLILIGLSSSISVGMTAFAVFLAGFAIIGGQGVANAAASMAYPTEIRATGVGWALGVGRVGSIVGPLIGGVLHSMNVPPRGIFFLCAVPALVAALAAAGLVARPVGPDKRSLFHK